MNQNTQSTIWRQIAASVAVLALVSLSSQAFALVLLTDDFNTPDTSVTDANRFDSNNRIPSQNNLGNDLATRQTGSLAPLAPIINGSWKGAILDDALYLQAGWGPTLHMYYNHNFDDSSIIANGGLFIQVNLNLYKDIAAGAGGPFFAMSFGQTLANAQSGNFTDGPRYAGSGYGFELLPAGEAMLAPTIQQFANGNWLGVGADVNWNSTGGNDQLDILLTTQSFAAGQQATVQLWINGAPINLGSYATFDWQTSDANYIMFDSQYGGNDTDGIDLNSIEFSTVPEPGILSLLAIGGAFLLWCKRRAS